VNFPRIAGESVHDKIIDYFQEQILKGVFRPGQRLPAEETLAEQLGVGRGTVREALRVLVHLGFIERRNKTTIIMPAGESSGRPSDFIDRMHRHRDTMQVIEVRRIIEPKAAELAAARGTKEEIQAIGALLQEMKTHLDDLDSFIRYDNLYHLAVFGASGNQVLLELIKYIQEVMMEAQALVLTKSHGILPRSLGFHDQVYEAIRDGNEKGAARIMEDHLIDIENEMYRIMKEESAGGGAR
jgi:DNA-binding FadR family transcriptional regulator